VSGRLAVNALITKAAVVDTSIFVGTLQGSVDHDCPFRPYLLEIRLAIAPCALADELAAESVRRDLSGRAQEMRVVVPVVTAAPGRMQAHIDCASLAVRHPSCESEREPTPVLA
jgi:hypothetical protein